MTTSSNPSKTGLISKAVKAPPVPVDHTYSHKEGSDLNPRYYYQDANQNYIRYTNAPSGHADNASHYGDAQLHPTEPTFEANPEYFTPDGRKLSRAPYEGAEMQWNPNYHENDPTNLWAGKWVNPVSGEHEYSYLDKDLRTNMGLKLNTQNSEVDVQLPQLRAYISNLFKSPQIKDQMIALALSLLDQGKMKLSDLTMLTLGDVKIQGNVVQLGSKIIGIDNKIYYLLKMILANPNTMLPLLSVPVVDEEGVYDTNIMHSIGNNLLSGILNYINISVEGLQTYHATQIYSQEMQNLLTIEQFPYEISHVLALMSVAKVFNYEIEPSDPTSTELLQLMEELLIDPLVVMSIKQNAEQQGLGQDDPTIDYNFQLPEDLMPFINSDLMTKTEAENEFSNWLHTLPIHDYAQPQE